jgi:heme A synthase
MRSPAIAGILSGLLPGLGQLYNRQWGKAAAFLLGALILDAVLGVSTGFIKLLESARSRLSPEEASTLLVNSIPFLALAVWSVLDAVRTAKRIRS